jgi:hypothetical protein
VGVCRRYFLCKLSPLSFDVKRCEVELDDAAWLPVNDVLRDGIAFVRYGLRLALGHTIVDTAAEYEQLIDTRSSATGAVTDKDTIQTHMRSHVEPSRTFKLFFSSTARPPSP